MKIIILNTGAECFVDDEDYEELAKHKWREWQSNSRGKKCRTTYACRQERRHNGKRFFIMMHRVILGMKIGDKLETDHIDNNGLNNCRLNLRRVTRTQNLANTKKCRTFHGRKPTSKYKGVCCKKHTGVWQAQIGGDKNRSWLGYFHSETEAALAYNRAAVERFGEYALLNEVDDV